jgi:hypothetical protein
MKSATIVPIAMALLRPQLVASDGVKVGLKTRGSNKPQQKQAVAPQPQNEAERDLYSSETIAMDQVAEPCSTVPAIVETEYTEFIGDDEFAGTNKTLSPTIANPRPTPLPTLEPTEVTTPSITFSTPYPTEPIGVTTPNPTESAVTSPEPTPNPTPYPEDDGGLTDDYYIATQRPTKRPTPHPTGKPSRYGFLPTSSYYPTNTDDIDDWASGWMPTNPSMDDDKPNPAMDDDDTDDWQGGYPIVTDDDNKYIHGKAGKSMGKSYKSGKSGKGSKSGSRTTDDEFNGYGNGLSKVSSLVSSEAVSSARSVGTDSSWTGVIAVAGALSGIFVFLNV